MNLELAAMRWLWLEQKCLVVLEQRTPFWGMGLPDVIGVTPGRYLTEIEIKRTVSDFKSDFQKPHRVNRNQSNPNIRELLRQHPRLFYYLVPEKIEDKVKPLLPSWAGLMSISQGLVSPSVKVRSPVNEHSPKLNLRQCVRLSRMMTTHMMTYALRLETLSNNWNYSGNDTYLNFTDWIDAEKGTYSI